jgi:membrane fusion protein (multidrug efflux system)
MNTRSVIVRALLANEDGALKPGMFLNVSLANDARDALVIPEEALTPEAEKQYVYVVVDGRASRREVRIGGRRPGSVEVLAGLKAGERVIVEGTQKVRDGAAVRAVEQVADVVETGSDGTSHEANATPASIRQ